VPVPGGLWLRRVRRPSGLTAVTVASGGVVMVQAPLVNGDEVVEPAEQHQVDELGAAAPGAPRDVVDVAGGRRLLAAREPAGPVSDDHRPAQVRHDRVGGLADIQRQAGGGRGRAGHPGAQRGGEPARTRQQAHRVGQDQVTSGLPGIRGSEVRPGRRVRGVS
jgi:hypothetical protein